MSFHGHSCTSIMIIYIQSQHEARAVAGADAIFQTGYCQFKSVNSVKSVLRVKYWLKYEISPYRPLLVLNIVQGVYCI